MNEGLKAMARDISDLKVTTRKTPTKANCQANDDMRRHTGNGHGGSVWLGRGRMVRPIVAEAGRGGSTICFSPSCHHMFPTKITNCYARSILGSR
ncbi:hypothetical protein DPMN_010954 [Dreissena polymorpha]|uniref:Uncharacterized protein n=1 Tax=Dreissena polymorpha TaxID=45954 RepID=A0A9D4N2P3_DREPO|nr:hypothetical protein DPMN_010954 [Dreissena polymorpha]